MKKSPKMWTKDEWKACVYKHTTRFEKHHKTERVRTWLLALNCTQDEWINDTDNDYYTCYKNWYIKTFTKLGRALE